MVATVAANIFRSIPPNDCQDLDLEEDDDPVLEPSWPHLSLVYDLLLRFLECPDLRLHAVQRVIDEKFVAKILELFDSEDVRERAVLKLVLHRIYSKFLPLRQFIRRRISDLFLGLAYEGGKLNGVGELLELVGSIVQGFSTPLKEEHKRTLLWVLMPLHKPPHLRAYHTHLTNCVVRFVEKDSALAVPVVASLLKFWPKTCSQKQVLFLNELEDIFDVTVPSVFELMVEPVFERLSSCFCSPQYQVLERSLALWSNEYFVYLVGRNVARVMPIVLPALFKAFKDHWNPSAGPMVCNVLEILMKADGHLFHQTAELRGHVRPSSATQRERHHLWRKNELQVRRSNKKN
ncbi:hypothetical protein AAG570_004914 [Ranatra chinensis]|uniref:Serine/threonine protein phosphatase 2A regulatory subunit n=1 Tax=Ranatra chinensis TaxID=642074 RepID=A0ABD0Y1F6_9HEMI